jgi:hypothetical protein
VATLHALVATLHATSLQLYGALKFTDIRVDRKIELKADKKMRGCWGDTLFYLEGKRII